MEKVIIGIIPTIKLGENENPYDDTYTFVDAYCTQITKYNAIPIGILLHHGVLDENVLHICDGFLFPGGNQLHPIHYQILEFAIKNNKPVLGICLGMQAMACYSTLCKYASKKNIIPTPKNLMQLRKKLQEENIYMLEKVANGNIHGESLTNGSIEITMKNLLSSTHSIHIEKQTKLYNILQCDELSIISLHSYRIYECGPDFIISAYASDGTIEAIEHKDSNLWIIGIQFHPELTDTPPIFKTFIHESLQRKK